MPPKEAGTEMLWNLNKCVYEQTDASRHWYLRVAEELSKVGVHKSIYDEAVFYWYFGNVLHGIICTHVDDFFWGGSARFKSSVIDRLKEVFQNSQESHYNFIYVGLQVSQHQDGIKMDQCAYISEMEVMEIDRERLHESLNANEKKKYRTLIEQLNWVSSQTRPDIAFEACEANVSFKDARVSDLTKANKVIRKLQSDEVVLQFSDLGDLKDCKILSYITPLTKIYQMEVLKEDLLHFCAILMEKFLTFIGNLVKYAML